MDGAVFLNGKLLEPKRSAGFELGHIITHKNGKQCGCGNKGCIEPYVSMKQLKRTIIEELELDKTTTGEQLQIYIRKHLDNEKLQNIFSNYVEDISIAITNYFNIFEPEILCIGGSFVYYEDILLPKVIQYINENKLLYDNNEQTRLNIKTAKLGNDAGIIGASEI